MNLCQSKINLPERRFFLFILSEGIVSLAVYLTPSWTVNHVMEVTVEAHPGTYCITGTALNCQDLWLSLKTRVGV